MRVLHIIVGLNVGGAELMLLRLTRNLTKTDSIVEHCVISLTSLGTVGMQLRGDGVFVKAIGMKSILGVPVALWKLFWEIKKIQPDIVQTWMYHADFLGSIAARLAGVRNIVWRICTTDVAAGKSKSTIFLRSLCAKISHLIPVKILCVAHAARDVHLSAGYSKKRMIVVSNGLEMERLVVDPALVSKFRSDHGFDNENIVIGSLGRFSAVKDQRNFVEAAEIASGRNSKLRFLMVGRGCEWENAELADWLTKMGLSGKFVLLGQRDDPALCLAAMDIFVLSSKTEGFPNVLGEAMAMGRRCVTTDVGDSAYLLGGLGVVVPAKNPNALADGIEELLNLSAEKIQAMSLLQRERVELEFSMEKCAQRFGAVYMDVLSGVKG